MVLVLIKLRLAFAGRLTALFFRTGSKLRAGSGSRPGPAISIILDSLLPFQGGKCLSRNG